MLRFLAYFAVSAASVVAVLLAFDYQRFELAHDKLREGESLRLELASETIARDLREVAADARALSQSQALQEYLQNGRADAALRLERAFINLAKHAAIYDQIRYLDSDGRERIRVNFNDGAPAAVEQARLQDKSARYYFRETIRLAEGHLYLSPLDLNIEHGVIEQPHKPMIRIAMPVFDPHDSAPRGVLVLNYLAAQMLARFADVMAGSWGEPMLLNEQGYWLYSAGAQAAWGFMWGDERTFAGDYPEAWKQIVAAESGTVQTPRGLFGFASLHPLGISQLAESDQSHGYVWKLVSRVAPEALAFSPWRSIRGQMQPYAWLLLIAAVSSLLLAWLRGANLHKTEALRNSEHRLRELVQQAPDGIFVADIDGRYTDVNAAGCRMLGYDRDQLIGKTITDLVSASEVDHLARVKTQLLAGQSHVGEWSLLRKDKNYLPVEVSSKILADGRWQGFVRDISERRRAEEALRASEERVRLLFESVAEGIVGVDLHGRCTFVNPAAVQLLGCRDASALIGRHLHGLIHHTAADGTPCDEQTCRVYRAFREGAAFQVDNEIFWRADGSYFDVEYRSHPIVQKGRIIGSVATFSNITERKHAEEKLRQSSIVFASTKEAIMVTDAERNIVMVNDAFTTITGYEAHEAVGKTPCLHQSGRHDQAFYQEIWAALQDAGHWQGEIWNRRKNGEVYPAWENISAVRDEQGQLSNYISVFSDISMIKQAEERLNRLAHHDALTGLPNRLLFTASLEQALTRAKRHQETVALLFLDLDRFKLINDTLGHAAGDRLLQTVARRLKHSVRAEDLVARLGGDEFTIVLEEISQAEDAALLAQKIIGAVAEPMELDGRDVVVSASVGISLYPRDADNAGDLAKAADAAMYRAKTRGRDTYQFYTAELTAQALEHLSLEAGLRQALTRGEFALHYQPQIEVKTGRILGVEALLRWQHPDLGTMLPEQFIGIAEESHLIDALGNWVLRQACAQARIWRDAGLPAVRIAINLSGRQIMYDHLLQTVEDTFEQNGLTPGDLLLELEITESVLQSGEHAVETLRRLRHLGIRIAIDDFGTGYSSLSHLKHLPIDTLKIDRLFMRNIPHDTDNQAITAAIISMGHSLGLNVVAEGVETEAQLDFLDAHGCDEAQGYLISPAVEAERIVALLRGESPRPTAQGAPADAADTGPV